MQSKRTFAYLLLLACYAPGAVAQAQPLSSQPWRGTSFDAAVHGFAFANEGWTDICLTMVGPNKVRYGASSPVCFDGWGLCGGMSLLAGSRYMAKQSSISLDKEATKRQIVDAQMRTLDTAIVSKWLNWIASPDAGHWYDSNHSVGYRMNHDWKDDIKPRLDRGEPVVIGLVMAKRARIIDLREVGAMKDLTSQHQVLAIGYREGPSRVEIRAYDPNRRRDSLILGFSPGAAGVDHRYLSGAAVPRPRPRGILYIRGVDVPAQTVPSVTPVKPADCCEWDDSGKRCLVRRPPRGACP